MKKILIISMFIFISVFIFGQNTFKERHLQKIKKEQAVKVSVWDISGKKYSAYLWYADSSQIILSSRKDTAENLVQYKADAVYRLKITHKTNFKQRYWNSFKIGEGIVFPLTGMIYSQGEAIMVPPSFMIGVYTIILVAPGSLLTAAVRSKDVNIDYIVDSDITEFRKSNAFLKKRMLCDSMPNNSVVQENKSLKNSDALSKIDIPNIGIHPNYLTVMHFYAGINYSPYLIHSFLNHQLAKSSFSHEQNSNINSTNMIFNCAFNLKNKIRIKAGFETHKKNFSFGIHRDANDDSNYFKFSYQNNFYINLGADYVFNPVNLMMLNKSQFSAGAGLVFSEFYIEGEDYDRENNTGLIYYYSSKRVNMFGFKLNVSYNYFINQHISLQANIGTYIMPNYSFNDVSYTGAHNEDLYIKNIKLNASDIFFNGGIAFHL